MAKKGPVALVIAITVPVVWVAGAILLAAGGSGVLFGSATTLMLAEAGWLFGVQVRNGGNGG